MFAEDMYTYRFNENRMDTIRCILANSIIERVRSRALLKTFSKAEAFCKSFYGGW